MSTVLSSRCSPLVHRDSAFAYDELAEALRYDPASQVTQILHQLTATSAPINQATYVYNNVGNHFTEDAHGNQARATT